MFPLPLLALLVVCGKIVCCSSFSFNHHASSSSTSSTSSKGPLTQQRRRVSQRLGMATVSPSDDGTVGVVGKGYVSLLSAKLAALRGYKSWLIIPPGEEENMRSLLDAEGNLPENLELIPATDDAEVIEDRVASMKALIVAVDDQSVMDEGVINYLLDSNNAKNVERIVGLSRNLNGKGMGFFVTASKLSANSEVWDASNCAEFTTYEQLLKQKADDLGAEYTICRAGTLKGGGCGGELQYSQYLSPKFYEATKKDIVTWNLIFDCDVRGVTLAKGDVMPGPGVKAVFSANSGEACAGDTSRCGIAEAMVRSLQVPSAANTDFGVATRGARSPPTEDDWDELFSVLSA